MCSAWVLRVTSALNLRVRVCKVQTLYVSNRSKDLHYIRERVQVTMISSFAHQITELEQKLQSQNDTVNKIYHCLVNYVEERRENESIFTNKRALDSVQARVKENNFRINDLGSKIKICGEEVKEVKDVLTTGGGEWHDWNGNVQVITRQ